MSTATNLEWLSRAHSFDRSVIRPPIRDHFALPEKILQFGTGVFLRAFVDAFIERANCDGTFSGRVVMVGSTGSGRPAALNRQDGLYTLCEQGLDDGKRIDRCTVISSVSRAIPSRDQWEEVLVCAANPNLEIVVSNTTEIGIRHDGGDGIDLNPPRSFPGKLTAFLYERGRAFDHDPSRGLIILCCELVERNGEQLREIVLALASQWNLGETFTYWLRTANRFCNTLVDRIVPGTPSDSDAIYARLGYRDDLLVQSEPYRLWVIQGNDELRKRLSFAASYPDIIVTDDITPYRDRKVRILNGTHTAMVPVSLLCGNYTVKDSMDHPLMFEFVRRMMQYEILPTLELGRDMTQLFIKDVLDRFANPFIRHNLIDITFQQTMKMRVRVLPSLLAHARTRGEAPPALTFSFAAYLLWLRDASLPGAPPDDGAEIIRERWREAKGNGLLRAFVRRVAADRDLWGTSLEEIPEFGDRVADSLSSMIEDGVPSALASLLQTIGSQTVELK